MECATAKSSSAGKEEVRRKNGDALRDEYTRTIEPARARAAEALKLERTLSNLVNQALGLTRS